MASEKRSAAKLRKELKRDLRKEVAKMEVPPPTLQWVQGKDELWTPIITVANIVMPLEPRPYQGFGKNERTFILTAISQMLSEVLFDCPRYIHSATRVAPNPDWDLLPFFEEVPTEPGTFIERHPKPSATQEAAGDSLPTA